MMKLGTLWKNNDTGEVRKLNDTSTTAIRDVYWLGRVDDVCTRFPVSLYDLVNKWEQVDGYR